MLKKLCKGIKDIIGCKYASLFATVTDVSSIIIKDGLYNINGFNGKAGDYINICGNPWECDKSKVLASGLIYGVQKLKTVNTIDHKFKYADFEVIGDDYKIKVISNQRILIVPNAEIAFSIFKANPDNYIFITPIGSKLNNRDENSIYKDEKFKIIVMLYNAGDINQVNNLNISNIIENMIIAGFKDYKFSSSNYAFSTANTTILEINLHIEVRLDLLYNCRCYMMDLQYPFIKMGELEKITNID